MMNVINIISEEPNLVLKPFRPSHTSEEKDGGSVAYHCHLTRSEQKTLHSRVSQALYWCE